MLGSVGAVVLVLFVLQVGPWLLTRAPDHGLNAEQELKAKNDVRTTLVQAVAGLAVATGAIVTYRAFRHTRLEQDRSYKLNESRQVTETYAKAVEQLGHDEAPVRIGALYSLIHLAQDNPLRRQTVVDVLCAYLRMPYTPPYTPVMPDKPAIDSVPDGTQELQVRQTAQLLLVDHLRRPQGSSGEEAQSIAPSPEQTFWPGISLNLTGATLVGLYMRATLVGLDLAEISVVRAAFTRATFCGETRFDGATFSDYADFAGATFTEDVGFKRATFLGYARFDGAKFHGRASFTEVIFSHDVRFDGATFRSASFARVAFDHGARFDGAEFQTNATFERAAFEHDARFSGATFRSANFEMVHFCHDARFNAADFSDRVRFDRAFFQGLVDFSGTTFSDHASFIGAHVLLLDDRLLNKGGIDARRVWPVGWTVRPNADDPTRGTLFPRADEVPDPLSAENL